MKRVQLKVSTGLQKFNKALVKCRLFALVRGVIQQSNNAFWTSLNCLPAFGCQVEVWICVIWIYIWVSHHSSFADGFWGAVKIFFRLFLNSWPHHKKKIPGFPKKYQIWYANIEFVFSLESCGLFSKESSRVFIRPHFRKKKFFTAPLTEWMVFTY